jgi:hypothetical protein
VEIVWRQCGGDLTTVSAMAWRQHGDSVATASRAMVWRRPLDGVGRRRCGDSMGMLARWDGEGVARPSAGWSGGASRAWRQRRAGVALAWMWRQGGDGVGRCGDGVSHGISITATLDVARQRWRHSCRWHDGTSGVVVCNGARTVLVA